MMAADLIALPSSDAAFETQVRQLWV